MVLRIDPVMEITRMTSVASWSREYQMSLNLYDLQLDYYRQFFMKGKSNKPYSNAYMEKAIEKASALIELLTKENEDLKAELEKMHEPKNISEPSEDYEELKKNYESTQKKLEQKDEQLRTIKKQLDGLEGKLEEKMSKNRQLHEKIGDLNHKYQQNLKILEKERKKNLALANQNQYLLKNFTMHAEKENQFQNYCSFAEQKFKQELTMVDRTKAAFSRKCQELKKQNMDLRVQLMKIRDSKNSLERTHDSFSQEKDRMKEIEQEMKRTNDALTYIIESSLRVKAEVGLYLKVEQIKNYLTYRLQHIEKLIKPIADLLGDQQMDHRANLEYLSTMSCRLSSYLGDLIK